MISIAKFLVFLCAISLIVKIYYIIRLRNMDKSTRSILGNMLFGVYGFGIIFPIVRRSQNSKEGKVIKIANIAITLFYIFFISIMILVSISYSGK